MVELWNTPGPGRCVVCWGRCTTSIKFDVCLWAPMCKSCQMKGGAGMGTKEIRRLRDQTMLDEIAGCVDG